MARSACAPVLIALLILLTPVESENADDRKSLEGLLQQEFKGQVFVLRELYSNDVPFRNDPPLRFDASGNLKAGQKEGPWPKGFRIQIDALALKKKHVELDASRRCVRLVPQEPVKEELVGGRSIRMRIDLKEPLSAESIRAALQKVFFKPPNEAPLSLPPYLRKPSWWPTPKDEDHVAIEGRPVYLIRPGSVQSPVCVSCPAPEYSQSARWARLQGVAVLIGIVTETGRMTDMYVVNSIGCGLDDMAVETIRGWKFRPAVRNGQPVPVFMTIEVDFHLY